MTSPATLAAAAIFARRLMRAQMIRIIPRSMRIVSIHPPRALLPRHPAHLVLVGALALLVGGCGDHLVKVDSSVLRLRIDEFSITPQLVQVHAGRLKINLVNTGILTHNVRVETEQPSKTGSPYVPGCAPATSTTGCGTGIAQPGTKVTSEKLTLQPGRYRLVDTIANHADLGDYGTLIVK